MSRIAVIADIHGNVAALEAVIADLEGQELDEILVGGDLVGRGPEGSRVVKRIRQLGWATIRGNHEDYLLGFRRKEVPEEWWQLEEWSASRWMAAELDESDVSYLSNLPFTLRSEAQPDLRLVHGSPKSNSEGLGPWLSDEEIARHFHQVGESLLVCAHTHRPMLWRLNDGLVANVGAVGLPFNRDQRAQYAVMNHKRAGWEVEFRQVPYDLERVFSAYERTGFLSEGGVTAELLRLELKHASPFLVPFLYWAEQMRLPKESSQLSPFLAAYDPASSVRDFFKKLRAAAQASP